MQPANRKHASTTAADSRISTSSPSIIGPPIVGLACARRHVVEGLGWRERLAVERDLLETPAERVEWRRGLGRSHADVERPGGIRTVACTLPDHTRQRVHVEREGLAESIIG